MENTWKVGFLSLLVLAGTGLVMAGLSGQEGSATQKSVAVESVTTSCTGGCGQEAGTCGSDCDCGCQGEVCPGGCGEALGTCGSDCGCGCRSGKACTSGCGQAEGTCNGGCGCGCKGG